MDGLHGVAHIIEARMFSKRCEIGFVFLVHHQNKGTKSLFEIAKYTAEYEVSMRSGNRHFVITAEGHAALLLLELIKSVQ